MKRTKGYALRAVFTLGAQYSFYYYLEQNTLMNAMVLLNTGPLFIPLIERVVAGSKIGKSTIASLVVGFLGVLCVLQPDQGIFTLMSLIGLLSGLCQGISQVLFGINVGKERYDLGVLSLFFFSSLFSLLPFLFGPPDPKPACHLVAARMLPPTPLWLVDMIGNVWECCLWRAGRGGQEIEVDRRGHQRLAGSRSLASFS